MKVCEHPRIRIVPETPYITAGYVCETCGRKLTFEEYFAAQLLKEREKL